MPNKLFTKKIMQSYPIKNLPAPYSSWSPMTSNPTCFGPHHDSAAASVDLNPFVLHALIEYIKGANSDICCIKISEDDYVSEWEQSDGSTIILRLVQSGKIMGCVIDSAKNQKPLKPVDGSWNLSSLYLMLILLAMDQSQEFNDLIQIAAPVGSKTQTLDPGHVFSICDEFNYVLEKEIVKYKLTGGSVYYLAEGDLAFNALSGTVICGTPKVFDQQTCEIPNAPIPFAQAKALFQDWADKHCWSKEEERRICVFPPDYPVPPEAIKIASRYVSSREFPSPMNNFMWRGVTGYGKSTGVELISAMLHMPLLRLTCNSTMETQDFLSKLIPNTDHRAGTSTELPDFDSIIFSPVDAYEQMTGKPVQEMSVTDCLAMREELMRKQIETSLNAETNGNGAQLFKMVESEFVHALKNGYICEVQELSRIKDPGVMVGLNEYDRAGAFIPLVDGSFVRRHPEAMVIFTDNSGYRSCHPIDPSVLRRMSLIIDNWEMPKDQVLQRVVYNTKFAQMDLLEKIYDIWDEIKDFCRDKDITDGCVSVAELESWAKSIMMDHYARSTLRNSCIECIVSKATSEQEEQEQIITAIVNARLK